MRVAVYARVSDDHQREEQTIESQIAALKEFASHEGLTLDEEDFYIDDGYSGFFFERPGLDRLRDAARDGLVDVVLIHDPDRLARRYAYQVLLLEEMQRWGVDVRFIQQPPADSPDQKLLLQIQGAIAEYERARIMERTRRGRHFWLRQGRPVCNHVPFGYRYIPRSRDEAPRVEVDLEKAETLRDIFRMRAEESLSYHQIAIRLNAQGIATPTGRATLWDPTTVAFILRDQAYLGTWMLNRSRSETEAATGKHRLVRRPREEWMPISLPPLLDGSTFAKAQEVSAQSQRGAKPLVHTETHLLRRIVACKTCGLKMVSLNSRSTRGRRRQFRYYWCKGPDQHRVGPVPQRCPHPTIDAPTLDDLVWSDIVQLLSNPKLLLAAWREQEGREGLRGEEVLDQELRRLKGQLRDVETQRQRLLIAYEQGAIELGELVSRRETLDEKTKCLDARLDALKSEIQTGVDIGDLTRHVDTICERVVQKLPTMTFQQKTELCRELVASVLVDEQTVEIVYRLPVSTNCYNSGVGPPLLIRIDPPPTSAPQPACLTKSR